jgi:hypothetical protein
VFDNGELYYQRVFPVKTSPFSTTRQHQLLHLDPESGRSRVLLRSSAPFTGPMRVRSGKLFYALKEVESGYENHSHARLGMTSVLYSRDLAAGRRSRRLFEEPFRSFEVLTDGAIITAADRRDAFGSVIRLYDPTGGRSEALLSTDLLVSDIVADSRELFVVARADWDNAQIYRVSVPGWAGTGESLTGLDPAEFRFQRLHDTPFQEAELCLAGGRLFYSATYGARRTVYEHDIASGAVYRSVGGDYARYPSWDEDSGTLYYIGLNEQGEDLYREKALTRPVAVPAGSGGVPAPAELEIPETEFRRGGYFDNLVSLRPRALFPVELRLYYPPLDFRAGLGLAGASALGDFQYLLLGYYDSIYSRPEVEAGLQVNILSPLTATFELAAAGTPSATDYVELALSMDLPLYQRLRKGFSYLSIGATAVLEWEAGGNEARILQPYGLLGFRGSASRTNLRISAECLHDVDEADFAYLLVPTLSTSVLFPGAELSMEATGLYDLEGLPQWSVPPLPGYPESEDLDVSWGGILFSTLSVPLLRLRGGMWNPGLYFGDLFLAPFFTLAFNQDRELQMSYGSTLRLEVKAGARDEGFPIDLYIGLGITREQTIFPLFGFELYGYGGGYARGDSGGRVPRSLLRH